MLRPWYTSHFICRLNIIDHSSKFTPGATIKPYLIPAKNVVFEEEIKKSRFITHLAHTPGMDAAKAFVEHIKAEHANARHNCWGFVAGPPDDSVLLGFSDDGEPSGTAGKPILAQLKGSGVGEICAVVTRYSGGIKLGTGGLVKAYGGGVRQALDLLETELKTPAQSLSLVCDYGQQSMVEMLVQEFNGSVSNTQFTSYVAMTVSIPMTQVKAFKDRLTDLSQGKILAQIQ